MSYFNEDQRDAMRFEAEQRCRKTEEQLNDAFSHLCKVLKEPWEIRMVAREDEAEMELYYEGECVSDQWDGDSHDVHYFLAYSLRMHEDCEN